MAHEIKIPSVGESVSEGTLAQWLKSDGDHVTKGENIVVIDTEKASQDLPADVSGILHITVQEGTDVKIGEVIGTIEEAGSVNGAKEAPAQAKVDADPAPVKAAAKAAEAPNATGQVFDIVVPSAGESVSEGTIAQWSKGNGDRVVRGEDIVVIDTEKASSDLQAEHSGILHILAQAGEDVKIGQVIGRIEATDTDTPAEPQKPLHVASPSPQPGTIQPPDQVPPAEARAAEKQHRPDVQPQPGQSVATPAAAAQAKEQSTEKKAGAQQAGFSANVSHATADGEQPVTREPMTRMRRTIAAHLLKAKQETAMLTTFNEVDMSAIMAIRKKHGEAFLKRHGVKLGFMSFFIQAATDALMRFPLVNASIDGNNIIYHHYVNMAVAVSTDRGLAVPVIKNTQDMGFAEIESSLIALAQKAKTGRIPLEDLKGGTFTVTNGGVFGSMMSTPLINPPQVAILGMHSIDQRAVVIDGKVEVRPMMYLAMSYDHRLIDGKEAVLFLNHIKDRIAAPEQLLIGL